MKMIGGIPSKISHHNLINRSQLTTPGQNFNKSSMSKLSQLRSEYASNSAYDTNQASGVQQLTHQENYTQLSKDYFDPFLGGKSVTYDARPSSTRIETFKELMAKKGCKCVCVDFLNKNTCGTYCRKHTAYQQRKIITQLVLKEQNR